MKKRILYWLQRTAAQQQGQITAALFAALIVGVIAIIIVQATMGPVSTSAAINRLEGDGSYVVLTVGQYNTISAKLDALKASADAAVANAALAVTAAEDAVVAAHIAASSASNSAIKVDLFNTADTFLFPADTDDWVLLTANAAAGNFSSWEEISNNGSVTLSSLFAANAGYISDVYIYQVTAPADTTHIVELAYGASKTSLTRIMFNSDNLNIAQVKSRRIPAGETIYYRIMTNTAPTEYVSIGFRYFFE